MIIATLLFLRFHCVPTEAFPRDIAKLVRILTRCGFWVLPWLSVPSDPAGEVGVFTLEAAAFFLRIHEPTQVWKRSL